MSKHKLPEQLKWPDQSEFSSADRNAVWNKIRSGEKKRTAKWLPYSLSAVAAAGGIFLLVQLIGVEEQAPVDQPEEEIEVIEEAVEPEVIEQEEPETVEEQPDVTEEVDLRHLNEGDVLNGWTAIEVHTPTSNKGGSYMIFEKESELTGEIYSEVDERFSIGDEDYINIVFEPTVITEDTFPVEIDSSQKITLAGNHSFFKELYGLTDQEKSDFSFETESILINYDPDRKFSIYEVRIFPDYGPPYIQYDPESIDEKIYFNGGFEFDGYSYEELSNIAVNVMTHLDASELKGLSPINILRLSGMMHIDYTHILYSKGFFNSEIEELGQFTTGELLEVRLSDQQAYVVEISADGSTSGRINFVLEEEVWKIRSVQKE